MNTNSPCLMKPMMTMIIFMSFLQILQGQTKQAAGSKQPSKAASNDCAACLYFPLCNNMHYTYIRKSINGTEQLEAQYDVVPSIIKDGKLFHGFKITGTVPQNNTIVYYNCDNGNLTFYGELPNYRSQPAYDNANSRWTSELYLETHTNNFIMMTLLKQKLPASSHWFEDQNLNGTPVKMVYTILDKDMTLTLGNKTYTDVIAVLRRTGIKDIMGGTTNLDDYLYFAPGMGMIKWESSNNSLLGGMMKYELYLQSYNKGAAVTSNIKAPPSSADEDPLQKEFDKVYGSIDGIIDPNLIGTWHFNDGFEFFYKFKTDGILEIYTGDPEKYRVFQTLYWKASAGILYDMATPDKYEDRPGVKQTVGKKYIQKMNDPRSNTPYLCIDGRYFFPMEKRPPFPRTALSEKLPDSIINTREKLFKTMGGVIDTSLVGVWRQNFVQYNAINEAYPQMHYVFNKDGTFLIYFGPPKVENAINLHLNYWRVNGSDIEMVETGKNEKYFATLSKNKDKIKIYGGEYILVSL